MLDSWKGKYRNYETKANVEATQKISWTVVKVVIFRVTSVLLLLGSAVLLTMATLFEPWKTEHLPNSPAVVFEISMWTVSRLAPPGINYFDDEFGEAPGWFHVWRSFIVIAIVFQYLAACYCIIMLLVRRNDQSKHFWFPAFISLASAALILTSMVLYVAHWDFGFLEDSRMHRMGWREDADIVEFDGWSTYVGYSSIGIMLFLFFFLMYAFFVDERFTQNYDTIRMKRARTGY